MKGPTFDLNFSKVKDRKSSSPFNAQKRSTSSNSNYQPSKKDYDPTDPIAATDLQRKDAGEFMGVGSGLEHQYV